MPDAHFIRATDSMPGSGAVGLRALPKDFVAASATRLGWACLIYAGTYLLAYLAGRLSGGYPPETAAITDAIAVGAILTGAVFYLAVQRRWFAPELLLDLGLIFWVIGAVGIDFPQFHRLLTLDVVPTGISWVCVWLVIFPLLVPNSPGKVLLAALLTGSAGPFSYLLASAVTGSTFAGQVSFVQLFVPYYLCVAMAVIASGIIYRMGCEVRQAREMGSYRLVERLGRGGMGEVWRAEHKLLARPAAVKLLRPDEIGSTFSTPERASVLLKRFEREAVATSALRSPHTIQLYDFGFTDDNGFYFAMELLEGVTLKELVDRFGPLPAARVAYIVRQACDSLAEAHENGLIHRDIKPSNIYLTRLGSSYDFIKVLDFGLVKKQSAFEQEDSQLTMEGTAPGTPDYMPPEIARGARNIDHRADIYSLGCVAYYLLTGQAVFQGDTPMEIVIAQVNSKPSLPSLAAAKPIPPELEQIVMRCLEKKPDDRPATASKLARLLSHCRFEEPWDNHQAKQWWREHEPASQPAETSAAPDLEPASA